MLTPDPRLAAPSPGTTPEQSPSTYVPIILLPRPSVLNSPRQNWDIVFRKSLHIHGFIVSRIQDKYLDSFYKEVPEWIATGKVKIREEIAEGLDKVGDLFVAVQKGYNTGKAVIKVADE